MIRQLFERIRAAFKSDREAPVRSTDSQTRARAKSAATTAILTAPVQRRSKRVKSGAGRLFRSYRPANTTPKFGNL